MALTLPLNGSGITFNIEHPKKDENGNFIQGRVLLFLSNNNLDEPRFQTNDKSSTAFVFGVDLKSKNCSKCNNVNNNQSIFIVFALLNLRRSNILSESTNDFPTSDELV